jgi:hypothetical protein
LEFQRPLPDAKESAFPSLAEHIVEGQSYQSTMTITKYEHLKHMGNLGDAEHKMERVAIAYRQYHSRLLK